MSVDRAGRRHRCCICVAGDYLERHRRPVPCSADRRPAHLRARAGRDLMALGALARELLGTRRLQPQLRARGCVAVARRLLPALSRVVSTCVPIDHCAGVDPAFALLWVVGMACAIGAAWQAKYHRLAALDPARRRGPRHLRHLRLALGAGSCASTQLLVEIVTTVLILLGLRWLPKRLARDAPRSADACQRRPRALRDLAIAIVGGVGMTALVLCGDDARTRPRRIAALLPRERLYARAAAPTSSTSSSSISAASTRWARSPCSASSR